MYNEIRGFYNSNVSANKKIMADIINIQTLVTAIIVAVPTSFFSVYLALKKYRTEKWWEKKAECYINTVNAMNDIIRFSDNTLAEELDGKSISNELREELRNQFHKGKMVLETQINIGRLLMSEESYKDLLSLDQALSKAEQAEEFTQLIAGIRVETEDCISSFVPHAKRHLGVQKL